MTLLIFIYVFAFVGFIDFIVEPTFSLLTDSTEKIIIPLIEEDSKTKTPSYGASRFDCFLFVCLFSFTYNYLYYSLY